MKPVKLVEKVKVKPVLSSSGFEAVVLQMSVPFYRLTVNENIDRIEKAEEVKKLFRKGKNKVYPMRIHIKTDNTFGPDEWQLELCLYNNGKVKVIESIRTEGV